MDLKLTDRVAIVCAASRGLGRETARFLAREGAKVTLCARGVDALEETAKALRAETGGEILTVPCDLTKGEDIERLTQTTLEHFGRIDILVTNIPHPPTGAFFDLDEDDWRNGFELIFLPVQRLCRQIAPHMRVQGWGRIVNIASYAIKEPNSTYLLSAVFRIGVAVMSKALAQELGGDGVRVNTLCPGIFHTELGDGILQSIADRKGVSFAEANAEMAEFTATKQLGRPEELAGYVAYLCSDLGNHVTGQVLMLDGGKAKGLF